MRSYTVPYPIFSANKLLALLTNYYLSSCNIHCRQFVAIILFYVYCTFCEYSLNALATILFEYYLNTMNPNIILNIRLFIQVLVKMAIWHLSFLHQQCELLAFVVNKPCSNVRAP